MNATDSPTGSAPEESLKQLRVLLHDVRSPLTSVLLWAQTLQIDECDPVRVKEGAFAIERSALKQEKCIKDLEAFIYKLVSP